MPVITFVIVQHPSHFLKCVAWHWKYLMPPLPSTTSFPPKPCQKEKGDPYVDVTSSLQKSTLSWNTLNYISQQTPNMGRVNGSGTLCVRCIFSTWFSILDDDCGLWRCDISIIVRWLEVDDELSEIGDKSDGGVSEYHVKKVNMFEIYKTF